jgi:hypothetical protein
MTASEYITLLAPQLASNALKDDYITMATSMTSSCIFEGNYQYAIALRACHIMTLASRLDGSSGAISSKSEGNASINYALVNSNDGLMSTQYGQQLKSLMAGAGVSITGGLLGSYC